jgi:hypothetical protein
MLYGMRLDEHIHISAMHLHKQLDKINNNDILDHLSWCFDKNHNQIKEYMSNGFSKLYQLSTQFQVNEEIYSMDEGVIIKIYNAQNNSLIESIDINEIKNIDLKFSPNDKFLCVTTYMYEIAVIEFKKSSKFNKNSNTEENIWKVRIFLIKGSKK